MLYYFQAELIYVGHTVAENGSPIEVTISKTIKVKEIKNFSFNYYNQNQRSMRLSKNIIVPKWMTEDVAGDGETGIEGVRYELAYVRYNGLKYQIREIMKYYKTALRVVLDIQEVR